MPAPKGNKNAVGNKGGGRITKYKPEYAKTCLKLARLGLTEKEMADVLGVGASTLHQWKDAHVEFGESLKEGKALADANVANMLYERALGYEHDEVDIRVVSGEIVQTPIRKYYPPDTTACIFWLKNRRPDLWREKREPEGNESGVNDVLRDLIAKLPG